MKKSYADIHKHGPAKDSGCMVDKNIVVSWFYSKMITENVLVRNV